VSVLLKENFDDFVATPNRQGFPLYGLSDKKREIIFDCLRKYTNLENNCCLSQIIYRIWNAVMAIFGQSDWDKATATMQEAVELNVIKSWRKILPKEEGDSSNSIQWLSNELSNLSMNMFYDALYLENNLDAENIYTNKWREKGDSIKKIFMEKTKLEHPTVNFRLYLRP